MDLPRKNICPLLKKECIKLDCMWFVKIAGTDPQDASKMIESWDCAIVWNLTIGLEVSKRVSAAGDGIQKAHESFRNEFAKAADRSAAIQIASMNETRQITQVP
jgi:hypothetical protein